MVAPYDPAIYDDPYLKRLRGLFDADRAERVLRQWTQAATAPGLTDAEIEDLLWGARTFDPNGNDPNAVLWTPTYDEPGLRRAAAQGWRLKAGKVTPNFDAALGNQTEFKRKQQYDMCLQMAAEFESGGGGGIASTALVTEGSGVHR